MTDPRIEDLLDEIDQLTGSKAALQTEIERLVALNDDLQKESQHRLEMLQRQKAEVERLMAERHHVKTMLEDILDRHGPKKE